MIREGGGTLVAAVAIVALLVPPSALAGDKLPKPPDPTPPISPGPAPPGQPPAAEASLELKLKGEKHGKVDVAEHVRVLGTLRPWRPGQEVAVTLQRGRRAIAKEIVDVTQGADGAGQFGFRGPVVVEPGHYQVSAQHEANATLGEARAQTPQFKVDYTGLNRGDRGKDVRVFNRLLDKQGYVPSRGRRFTNRTGRAVLAYRKVHGMAPITRSTPGIYKKLAAGRGTYKLRRPGAGKHAEVSIGRQVMVLADNGKAQRIYPVSTGKSSTPTVRGHFRFYRRQPGFNNVGMYYSVYFHRGYAIHGYRDVPARYPASHGCVRTPIPDAVSIYNWVRIGMSIHVY
jgi:lipoprotein-anchoring transpeptidase ErfK/SrfK